MKLSPRSLPLKLVLFLGYPIISVLFVVLGLGASWGPWSMIATSGVVAFIGLLMLKPIYKAGFPALASSISPHVFDFSAWGFGSLFYAAVTGGELYFVGLGMVLNTVMAYIVYNLLEKRGFIGQWMEMDGSPNHRTLLILWITYVISSSAPTSVGLARINHIMSALPIIVYGMVFGWFGLEMIPRLIPGDIRPLLLEGAYFFFVLLLYGLSETINPALAYLTPDWLQVVLLSYIACYAMLVSRCIYEVVLYPDRIHTKRLLWASTVIKRVQIMKLVEAAENSFRLYKVNRINRPTGYMLLFLKDRMSFVRVSKEYETEELEKELRELSLEVEVEKPESLSAVSPHELLKLDEKNFEIIYEDISRIEIRESATDLERAFRTGVLIIKGKEKLKFDIAPNQEFEKCEEVIRVVLPEKMDR